MTPQLYCIVEKFPGFTVQIGNLYDCSNEFKSLCDDYFICITSLEDWQMNDTRNQLLIEEYTDLQRSLESEVLRYIDRYKTDNY